MRLGYETFWEETIPSDLEACFLVFLPILSLFAALAQLVEHPHGKGKVMGSCPIGGSIETSKLSFS